MKLGIGTVQFGLNYGISNANGVVEFSEVQKIISFASLNGIEVLDSAHLYGNSEEVIGKAIASQKDKFRIISKTAKISNSTIQKKDLEDLKSAFDLSLARLNVDTIDSILFHSPEDLVKINGDELYKVIKDLKKQKLVKKIGISAYSPEQLRILIEKFDFDIVQIPFNIFDQRFLRSGLLKELKLKKIEVHVRSSFLQGLIFLKVEDINNYFNPYLDVIKRFHEICNKNKITPLQAALLFISRINEIDIVVCGVTKLKELEEIFNIFSGAITDEVFYQLSDLSVNDENFVNPSKWRLL